MLDEIIPVC